MSEYNVKCCDCKIEFETICIGFKPTWQTIFHCVKCWGKKE